MLCAADLLQLHEKPCVDWAVCRGVQNWGLALLTADTAAVSIGVCNEGIKLAVRPEQGNTAFQGWCSCCGAVTAVAV